MKKKIFSVLFIFTLAIVLLSQFNKESNNDTINKKNNLTLKVTQEIHPIQTKQPKEKFLPKATKRPTTEKEKTTKKTDNNKLLSKEPSLNIIPIELAERFFIPREQRTSGNIGGPPPLPYAPNPDNINTDTAPIAPDVLIPPK